MPSVAISFTTTADTELTAAVLKLPLPPLLPMPETSLPPVQNSSPALQLLRRRCTLHLLIFTLTIEYFIPSQWGLEVCILVCAIAAAVSFVNKSFAT
ncbi:hypothetical protein HJC23_003549 [Cyclotella cryptica]|uniref:Uncharacterized protein n=1 Tax=Cyclotella cryptica TaxID=29204 RepID=A0ABD3P3T5_9STRA